MEQLLIRDCGERSWELKARKCLKVEAIAWIGVDPGKFVEGVALYHLRSTGVAKWPKTASTSLGKCMDAVAMDGKIRSGRERIRRGS